ncbi:uncharacterized protein [Littorina saxatilis]|uniref:uncharacterized protein n=1 Tax=Littorina saxatilis TaxID=31220 RepID=UPI0038B5249F
MILCFQRMNLSAANALRDFLREMDEGVDFEHFTPEQLNETLARFYVCARTHDGQLYRGKSLQGMRYALNRYLQAPPHNKLFDVIKDPVFKKSNENFKLAMAEIKSEGKGDVRHTPPLSKEDLQRLYNSMFLNTKTPAGLGNKVQFDIRVYFLRRGCENMDKMTKNTFSVKTNPTTGKKYVIKEKDELTKNHREMDSEKLTATMPETGDDKCPVASYEKYLSLLHPDCDRLWTFPNDSFTDEDKTWYSRKPMGYNTLRSFMPKLSKLAKLSQVYTNHSARATGVTILADADFSPIDIMSASTHKSVSSLAVYQRTSLTKKLEMGNTISADLNNSRQLFPLSGPSPSHAQPSLPLASASNSSRRHLSSSAKRTSTSTSATISSMQSVDIAQQDLEAFFDTENEPEDFTGAARRPSVPSIFQNCQIGTVNIYHK